MNAWENLHINKGKHLNSNRLKISQTSFKSDTTHTRLTEDSKEDKGTSD